MLSPISFPTADQFYTNLEYLDLQYFPVNLEDYEGTRCALLFTWLLRWRCCSHCCRWRRCSCCCRWRPAPLLLPPPFVTPS